MKIKRLITAISTTVLTAGMLFAASPSFSMKMNGAIGAYNIQNNPTVVSVPGLSDNSKFDFNFNLKGKFGKEATYKGAGYNSGIYVNVDSLYRNYIKQDNYVSPDNKYANNYIKIQKMIDWYEANKHRYGLPDNPFGPKGWPEGKYGEGNYSYKFINGTAVENIHDVNWNETSNKWASAEALYHDIKAKIEDTLESLYKDKGINPGNRVNQDEFARMNAERKEYAILKLEALNSFNALTENKTVYPAASGYIEFTNIGGMFDIRADLANSMLSAGKLLRSSRTGQSQYGSSVRFELADDFIKGLNVGLSLGIAGGVAQRPEMWDTQFLDYNPGYYGELAAKLDADYTYELEDLNLDITAGLDFIMSDLLVSPLNNAGALRFGIHYNDFSEYIDQNGFYLVDPVSLKHEIEVSDVFEFVYLYTKDHYDRFDTYENGFACGLKNELYFNGYGAELKFNTTYKTPNFESKYKNQIEDRFAGTDITSDFRSANLAQAAAFNIDFAYNTFRLLNMNIATLKAGFNTLLYDDSVAAIGWNAGFDINLVDYLKKDLIFSADVTWYKNNLMKTFDDMEILPEQTVLDFMTISAGITYKPLNGYVLGLNCVSKPSNSRRYSTRLTSVEATVSISY